MLKYSEVASRRRISQSLAGLSPEAFAQLVPAFQQAYERVLTKLMLVGNRPAPEPATLEGILTACSILEFVTDGAMRPIQRPKDYCRQQKLYSRRKERHTIKGIVLMDRRSSRILSLGRTRPGRMYNMPMRRVTVSLLAATYRRYGLSKFKDITKKMIIHLKKLRCKLYMTFTTCVWNATVQLLPDNSRAKLVAAPLLGQNPVVRYFR